MPIKRTFGIYAHFIFEATLSMFSYGYNSSNKKRAEDNPMSYMEDANVLT